MKKMGRRANDLVDGRGGLASLALICVFVSGSVFAADQPNIVLIVADDLGWNDVGFHGSNQIPTPNIDALAYNGIILNSHYVQSTCTPSRTALLTGKYPMRLGMQGYPLLPAEKRAVPEGKLLPEYFKDLGYSTHLIGKWHLGYSSWNETPTFRGFDHHFGYYNGFISYYDYLSTWTFNDKEYTGFDLRKDGVPAFEEVGKYVTDAFTEHAVKTIEENDGTKPLFLMVAHTATHAGNVGKLLEAPQETINKFKHVEDSNRRTYAAMVSKLDDSVGTIVEALANKNMLSNSIVVFLSDNGAATVAPAYANWGSNYPLRGVKQTLFEGGIRGAAFIYSPLLVQSGRVSTDLMHITDWLPTLYSAAGGDIGLLDPDLDGIDQWSSLVYDLPSPRNDILINIDEKTRNAGLRFYNWKLIVGTSLNGTYNDYYGHLVMGDIEPRSYDTASVFDSPAGRSVRKASYTPLTEVEYEAVRRAATLTCLEPKAKKNPCDPASGAVCLYDIPSDPCEENDLAKFFPSVVRRMKRALVDYRKGLVPQADADIDIEVAQPKLFRYTWNPWVNCADSSCQIPA
ncbi:arylsulfatase B-like [Anoplophora glabripennis]|uniref:arylsulfatase B-like n=1 Tax=Anoplophora glabripennis TaxID=217634 RepID=UPI0008740E82|nr:arylsulfatase B-like [Anoplophora glabripennis]